MHAAATVDLDVAEVAIVLVDTWAGHPMPSHLERTGEICRTRIRPMLDAARAAGATVIYAPSPRVAPDFEVISPRQPRDRAAVTARRRLAAPGVPRHDRAATASLRKRPGELPEDYDGPTPDWYPIHGIDPSIIACCRETWWWRPARSCTRHARRAAWCT